MNARASRRHWIRNRAWAMLAALVPASECLAAADPEPSPAGIIQSISASYKPGEGPAAAATAVAPPRTMIPPPRKFSEQEIRARVAAGAAKDSPTRIPPPRTQVALETTPRFSPVPASVESPAVSTTAEAAKSDRDAEPDEPRDNLNSALQALGVATVEPKPAEPQAAPAPQASAEEPAQASIATPEAAPAAPSDAAPTAGEATPAELPANPASETTPVAAAASAPAPESSPAPAPVAAAASAPAPESSPAPAPVAAPAPEPVTAALSGKIPDKTQDKQVDKAACTSCGMVHSSLDGHMLAGCGSGNCIPGRGPCNPPANECDTVIGGFLQNLYQSICCPDPCYQPRWEPEAYASFFADYARPRTVTRLRYDNLENMTRPDRNQFWINQVKPVPKGRSITNPIVRIQELSLYQEAAGERGSFFVEYPYRQINQSYAPTQAGFGDVKIGTKSLMFDTELLQVSFQFRSFMPSGNFMNNLGTGQFAVDPSILTSLKLGPTTYFQGQFGNWIPVGGPGQNNNLAGGIFYWLMSLNQVLWYTTPESPLIATLEMDGWSFENGGYTTRVTAPPAGSKSQPVSSYVHRTDGRGGDGGGVSYFNIGPGLRQSICNKLDFGGAITWATDTAHWAQPWFRFEVRFLF